MVNDSACFGEYFIADIDTYYCKWLLHQSDEVWMNNCQKLMDLTGDLPLGLYETPIPKVRSLTPPMLKWIAETGRFVFHKDTSLDTQTMLSKMAAVKSVPSTPLKWEAQICKISMIQVVSLQYSSWMVVTGGVSYRLCCRFFTAKSQFIKICLDSGGK